MRTIYKYPLAIAERQTIMVPTEAEGPSGKSALPEFLATAVQHGQICLWALVDSELPPKPYTVTLCATGCACDSSVNDYIGTVQMVSGRFILHVFVARKTNDD